MTRRRHGPVGSYPNQWPISHGGRYGFRGIQLTNEQLTTGLHNTTISIKCPAGGVLTIYWGDGTASAVTCNNVLNAYAHTYSATGQYTVRVVGTTKQIVDFRCQSQAWISGDIVAVLSGLSPAALTSLHIGTTAFTGNLSSLAPFTGILSATLSTLNGVTGNLSVFSGMTSISYLLAFTQSWTGDISAFASCPLLTTLYIMGITNLTYSTPTSLPAWTGSIWAYSSGLSSAEVDRFLIDLADGCGTTGTRTLKIAGTNAARTSASDAAKAALLAAGWTLEVNE
jgi:hypothetical protein